MGDSFAVRLRGIDKIYPGSTNKANDDISLDLSRGEILCIAGENGAGKTTLMKILSGLEAPSSGSILVNDAVVNIDSPHKARSLGLGMVHQHFMLFPEYTVAENIVIGIEPRRWGIFFDTANAKKKVAEIIDRHGFSIDPGRPVKTLTVGEMQQVEICRLLYRNADIIILDEPSAILTEQETATFFRPLRMLASGGTSLFLITHKLKEIKLISDRVAVLRKGRLVAVCDTKTTDEYEISRLMFDSRQCDIPVNSGDKDNIGITIEDKNKLRERPEAGRPVIAFDKVTVLRHGQRQPILEEVSFEVRSGEVLGFAGVGGNGLGVLEALLGGFLHPSSGRILRNGQDISALNIRRLRRQGLAYVPGDRLRVGSAAGATIDENIIINIRDEFTKTGFLDNKAVNNFSADLIRHYHIDGAEPSSELAASVLSGGNLQKLILARETAQFRDYFVFSEPSWGLDIAASAFVWKEISALRTKGAAIVLISTNLDEVLTLADRIAVMYRGSIAAIFDNGKSGNAREATELKEKIGNSMQGLGL